MVLSVRLSAFVRAAESTRAGSSPASTGLERLLAGTVLPKFLVRVLRTLSARASSLVALSRLAIAAYICFLIPAISALISMVLYFCIFFCYLALCAASAAAFGFAICGSLEVALFVGLWMLNRSGLEHPEAAEDALEKLNVPF